MSGRQLDLFGLAPGAAATPDTAPPPGAGDRVLAERLAAAHHDAARLAARLPPEVRFGTSSWSFPGWAGLVWSRRASTAALARHGLAEYARHPLLRTVGIDRGFHAPIPPADLERYAQQLPAGFPCCAKAPAAVASPVVPGDGARANPDFLHPGRFVDEMVGPFLERIPAHAGPFLVQVPPAPPGARLAPPAFAERLDAFLAALPRAGRYAVELRDATLLTPAYRAVLARHGAAHVLNYAARMPGLTAQAGRVPPESAPFAVVRLLLRPGSRYAERRDAFAPFDHIQDQDDDMRAQAVEVIRRASAARRPVFILVNNKAEGSAPLTILGLAARLAAAS